MSAEARHDRSENVEGRAEPGEGTAVADPVPSRGRNEPGSSRLLGDEEAREFRDRWEAIQTGFIDEPRESVRRADELVEDVTDTIVTRFEDERDRLEDTWEEGEEVSTETLRVALQRYRSFFDRLLEL